MKSKLQLLALMIIASLFAGCANGIDGFVPPITASKLDYTRTGKFSSTTVKVEGLKHVGDKVTAERITIQHSNAWIPNVQITAEGYERTIKPSELAK
jgi:hypothetical protein